MGILAAVAGKITGGHRESNFLGGNRTDSVVTITILFVIVACMFTYYVYILWHIIVLTTLEYLFNI